MSYGVYVHIPWCRTRCPYCAFTVVPDRGSPYADYTRALLDQWRALSHRFPGRPATLYFGGGTPSLHPSELLGRLIQELDPAPGAEISMEVNPGTADREKLAAWRSIGVTRLSLGVQTFDPRFARVLNRAHTVREARSLVEQVAGAGFPSWSVDLIFAVPGQSPADFEVDLAAIAALSPPHVSLYGLTAEPGTPYARAVRAGKLTPPDDDAWAAMYDRAIDALGAAGLARYEVSNLAREGHRCRHNEGYWRGRAYAGLGVGAHGFLPDGARTVGPSDLASYLARPRAEVERPPPRAQAIDLLISTMRHVDGAPTAALRALGFSLEPSVVEGLRRAGAIAVRSGDPALDGDGWRLGDAIVERLVAALIYSPAPPTQRVQDDP